MPSAGWKAYATRDELLQSLNAILWIPPYPDVQRYMVEEANAHGDSGVRAVETPVDTRLHALCKFVSGPDSSLTDYGKRLML